MQRVWHPCDAANLCYRCLWEDAAPHCGLQFWLPKVHHAGCHSGMHVRVGMLVLRLSRADAASIAHASHGASHSAMCWCGCTLT